MTSEVGGPARGLSLRANFAALTVGRVLAALAQWAALIVVAKASDVETVGQFALAQVICVPIAEVARMGLRDVRATDVGREHPFSEYFGLRILTAGVAFVVMVAVGAVVADSTSVFVVIVIYAASRVVELLSDIVYGLFQLQGRLDYIGRSLSLVAPLSIAMLTIGMVATGSLVGAVLGQLCAYVIVFVFYDMAVARRRIRYEVDDRLGPSWERSAIGQLFRIATPLAIASLFAIVAVDVTRWLVALDLGTDALGIFTPIFVLAMAPSRLVDSLGTAATTPLAALHLAGDRRGFVVLLTKLAIGALGLGFAGVVVAATVGEWVLGTVYTSDYETYADLFVILVVAGALRFEAVLLQYGVVAARRFWWLTAQFALVAVVATVAGIVLVPRGLEEAGLAVVIVFATQLVAAGIAVGLNLPEVRNRSPRR